MSCIFCDIVAGHSPCHKVWEDEHHLAFLSIFPNTKGVTVVMPKAHYSSYAFDLPDKVLTDLVLATKTVAILLNAKFENVGRTGMIFEGFGVDHVHAKLFPMHGTADIKTWQPIESRVNKYFDQYEGYLSSHDHLRADDNELALLAKHLRE